MRVFISEYLCSGALAGTELPPSLLQEGRAMRDALLADFAALPQVDVLTTHDPRVPPLDGIRSLSATSPEAEAALFRQLASDCDAACVIAPELNGILTERVRLLAELSPRPLNASPEAVATTADKLALAARLSQAGVPTIPTTSAKESVVDTLRHWDRFCAEHSIAPLPAILKPRFGAGSQAIHLCRTEHELREHLQAHRQTVNSDLEWQQLVIQPFITGRALSVAALAAQGHSPPTHTPPPDRAHSERCTAEIFPIGEQRLSRDGRFTYLGGQIPAPGVEREPICELIASSLRTVPGLHGYIGWDLLVPAERPDAPLVVEINPRLTTSYIGYRKLTRDNLAARLLQGPSTSLTWEAGRVEFDPTGTARRGT